jgi:pilus assembly protein CpaB
MARMQGLALPSGNRGLLVVAALAGLAAAVLFVVAVNNDSTTSTVSTTGGTGNTIVATKTIPSGAVIKDDMVTAAEMNEALLIPNAFTKTGQAVGQVAKYEILPHDQINASKVGAVATGSQFSSVPKHGMRAASLKVTEVTAVGGLLSPGDRVDIIGTFKIKDRSLPEGQSIIRTKTVLENVEVLSVGPEHLEPLAATNTTTGDEDSGASGTVPGDVKEQPGATTITLSLDPEQVQVLVSVQQTAKTVSASLRPIGDTDRIDPAPHDEIVSD